MSRRNRRKSNHQTDLAVAARAVDESQADGRANVLRRWVLAGVAMLFVARPLVDSDGGPWFGDGQPFTMLWIILAALCLLGAVGGGRFSLRWTWLDTIAAAFFGWWILSAALAMKTGAPRPTINMLCDGGGTLLAFVLLRQIAPTGVETRTLLAMMIALAVALSCLAVYERFVEKPQQIAQFKTDPQPMLRVAGYEDVQPGSADFKRFEDRLNSPEPIATFSLTNSLAAFLAPWLIVTIGIGLFGGVGVPPSGGVDRLSRPRSRIWLGCTIIGTTIAFALLLTHSRSAWIGTTIGGVALVAWRSHLKRSKGTSKSRAVGPGWRGAIIGLFLLVTVAIAMIAVWLPAVLAPALKSFEFRLEYWQATLAMIRDHAVWGVGPGNFADAYTFYKLPISSEEIQDPHNFLLELAANAGIPAAIAFLTLIFAFARRVWRCGDTNAGVPPSGGERRTPPEGGTPAMNTFAWICGGAAAGFGLGMLLNKIWGFDLRFVESFVGVAIGAGVIALLWPWVKNDRAPAGVYLAGVSVLLIAVLAVGGMTHGGVAGSLWLLLALGANATEVTPAFHASSFILHPSRHLPQWTAWAIFAMLIVVAGAQFACGYLPVRTCCVAMNQAGVARSAESREAKWLAAAEADPWDYRPHAALAAYRLRQWREKRRRWDLKDFETFTDAMLSTDPNFSSLWSAAAQGYLAVFRADAHEKDYGRYSVQCAGNAVAHYPTSAEYRLLLADALSATGDLPRAREAAREARRLDDIMPHEDRKLTAEQRTQLSRIISGDKQAK